MLNEGIVLLKNSKRIRRLIHQIKAKTRKVENEKLQSFVNLLEKRAKEFEAIEQEYKIGDKKAAKEKYKKLVEENKTIVDKINSESFKKFLKILGVISVLALALAIFAQVDEFGASRFDRAFKSEDRLFDEYIRRTAREYGVDSRLVKAIIKHESGGDPHIISANSNGTKDYGLMQINSGYIKYFKSKFWEPGEKFDPLDKRDNVKMGIKYLSFLIKYYHGDTTKAIMAYNAGPTTIDAGKVPAITAAYVAKIKKELS